MEQRRRTLVAAQPGAWSVLRSMLDEVVDPVPVHSIDDGFQVLDHDSRVELIIATIAFDLCRLRPEAARAALQAAVRACLQ